MRSRRLSSFISKYLTQIAISLSVLALGGWLNFMVSWGQVRYALANTETKVDGHVSDTAAHTRTETVGAQKDRLDRIEGRLDRMETEQRAVNERIIQSLGRIEGKVQ